MADSHSLGIILENPKMKIQNKLFVFIFLVLSSCSSIKITTLYQSNKMLAEPVGQLYLFSPKDSIPNDVILIGEFTLVEDLKNDWVQIKAKLLQFAQKNNANGVIVERIGWSLKGHGFYLQGKLFYCSDERMKILHEYNNSNVCCNLIIFRDEGEPALGASFKMDLSLNEVDVKNFQNRQTISFSLKDCNNANLKINKKLVELKFENNENKYLKLTKEINGSAVSGSIGIGIGGIIMQEIHDQELGKLLSEQNKNYAQ
jgi:flagellar biosynthesis/type III secretory pathway chaperone